ncbi:DUF2087 domain-containing protein [Devosia rhizoryzae]|uniref:DUF2087 domain-containing protein n=1 Tax=Devosia rhizoryzae TaxID=2774137 RepID=A0ABX7C7J6_9HYPH|nr:DUF2087 domain-containing protein [Devosia rhizoryzae]QQR38605.1 DUF2087 domain-containing protein [Devosia rhizoryzae]
MSAGPAAKQMERVARCFDAKGRLQRWPSKRSEQVLVLWVVWSQLPDDVQMSESEVSAMLRGWHDYEDFALLRRDLCDLDLLRRTPDGRIYRKIAQDMPEEARILAERVG